MYSSGCEGRRKCNGFPSGSIERKTCIGYADLPQLLEHAIEFGDRRHRTHAHAIKHPSVALVAAHECRPHARSAHAREQPLRVCLLREGAGLHVELIEWRGGYLGGWRRRG